MLHHVMSHYIYLYVFIFNLGAISVFFVQSSLFKLMMKLVTGCKFWQSALDSLTLSEVLLGALAQLATGHSQRRDSAPRQVSQTG